jgi:hypothetical protein
MNRQLQHYKNGSLKLENKDISLYKFSYFTLSTDNSNVTLQHHSPLKFTDLMQAHRQFVSMTFNTDTNFGMETHYLWITIEHGTDILYTIYFIERI